MARLIAEYTVPFYCHYSHVNSHTVALDKGLFTDQMKLFDLKTEGKQMTDGTSLKLVDKFTYLESSSSSTEKDIDTRPTKAWTAIDRLSIIWKSDLTDKMKRSFFQVAVV